MSGPYRRGQAYRNIPYQSSSYSYSSPRRGRVSLAYDKPSPPPPPHRRHFATRYDRGGDNVSHNANVTERPNARLSYDPSTGYGDGLPSPFPEELDELKTPFPEVEDRGESKFIWQTEGESTASCDSMEYEQELIDTEPFIWQTEGESTASCDSMEDEQEFIDTEPEAENYCGNTAFHVVSADKAAGYFSEDSNATGYPSKNAAVRQYEFEVEQRPSSGYPHAEGCKESEHADSIPVLDWDDTDPREPQSAQYKGEAKYKVLPPASAGKQRPLASACKQRPPASAGKQSPPASAGKQSPPASAGKQRPPASAGKQSPPASAGGFVDVDGVAPPLYAPLVTVEEIAEMVADIANQYDYS